MRGDALPPDTWYDYPPAATAQVRFANGAKGVFSCSLAGHVPYTANTHIIGEKGSLLNDRFYLKRFQEQKDFFQIDTGMKKSGDVYSHPFPAIVEDFITSIREKRESCHNLASVLNSHKACFAIQESILEGGKWVKV